MSAPIRFSLGNLLSERCNDAIGCYDEAWSGHMVKTQEKDRKGPSRMKTSTGQRNRGRVFGLGMPFEEMRDRRSEIAIASDEKDGPESQCSGLYNDVSTRFSEFIDRKVVEKCR